MADVYGFMNTPKEEVEKLIDKLKPIADKWGVTLFIHEIKNYKVTYHYSDTDIREEETECYDICICKDDYIPEIYNQIRELGNTPLYHWTMGKIFGYSETEIGNWLRSYEYES